MKKIFYWVDIDTKKQKLGEQMRIDTPIILVVNDGYCVLTLLQLIY